MFSSRVGGRLKLTVKELMLFNSQIPVNSTADVLSLLRPHTSHKVFSFSKEDIARVKEKIPPKLKELKGALMIHEVKVSSSGVVEAKKLPSDAQFFPVATTSSFNPAPSMAGRMSAPMVTVVEE